MHRKVKGRLRFHRNQYPRCPVAGLPMRFNWDCQLGGVKGDTRATSTPSLGCADSSTKEGGGGEVLTPGLFSQGRSLSRLTSREGPQSAAGARQKL